jgi:hypothetical protein
MAAAGTAAVTVARAAGGTAGSGTSGAAGMCAIAVGRPGAAFAASTIVAEVSECPDPAHCFLVNICWGREAATGARLP